MTRQERETAARQQTTISRLMIEIEAKFQTWQEIMDMVASHAPALDIRNEYDALMNQGERGREIALGWGWALAFSSA